MKPDRPQSDPKSTMKRPASWKSHQTGGQARGNSASIEKTTKGFMVKRPSRPDPKARERDNKNKLLQKAYLALHGFSIPRTTKRPKSESRSPGTWIPCKIKPQYIVYR
jgi:hypothetical protein